jgi:glycosyltransferase involved in cell wall biosynthesis
MACILKFPSATGRGLLTITSPEYREFLAPDLAARHALNALRSKWVLGQHHNWHDFGHRHDPLFDFHLAGELDLGLPGDLVVPLDACNFVPAEFGDMPVGAAPAKFWDVLVVSRPVAFKRVDRMLEVVRHLYDRGRFPRVLFICPMPPETPGQQQFEFRNVLDDYMRLFDAGERRLFTILKFDYDYPFPLDLATLAHYYRSSRVFLHLAADERRTRVAAYAWASGLPVVAARSVGSLLPADLRRSPYFFGVGRDEAETARVVRTASSLVGRWRQDGVREIAAYAEALVTAIETAEAGHSPDEARRYFEFPSSYRRLAHELNSRFPDVQFPAEARDGLAHALDIRLGRHCDGGHGPNSIPLPLPEFVRALGREDAAQARVQLDPELWLAQHQAPRADGGGGL